MTTENYDKLRSEFFDQADLLFYLFDKDLNLIDVNENGLKTFHFKKENIIGKNLAELSPDNRSSGRFDLYKEVIRTGKPLEIDEMKPHPSLGNMHFRIKAFKVGNGLGLISKNITDLKEIIDELETFISKTSHDMRSPIATILGITNISKTQVKDIDEAKHFLKIVQEQTQRLDSILQILMETMKIRKIEKTIRMIDFEKTIDNVLSSLSLMKGFDKVKFTKNISVNQKFYSDDLLLISIFHNLVDNAIKYKRNVPDAYIKISVVDKDGGVNVAVGDNGIGIPDNLQNDVYKMFFRGTNQASGSGLGLYIINHSIKKLGGHISLVSKEKIGTEFTVYLPNENIKGKIK